MFADGYFHEISKVICDVIPVVEVVPNFSLDKCKVTNLNDLLIFGEIHLGLLCGYCQPSHAAVSRSARQHQSGSSFVGC